MSLVKVIFCKYVDDRQLREHVADVYAPDDLDTTDALEYVYATTQNIASSWSKDLQHNVTLVEPLRINKDGVEIGHRSSMEDDQFVMDGTTYRVAAFGFQAWENTYD
jgi:hypothetical protein